MRYKGTYNAATPYSVGDCVFGADGNGYHCVIPNTGAPVTGKCWERTTKEQFETMQLLQSVVEQVSVEIVDALNSTSSTKALSANQGKALKDLIDALDVRVTALEPEPEPEDENEETT